MATKKILKSKPLYRAALFQRQTVDEEQRTVELAFSSEEPADQWFGREILDHSPGSVRLGRLRDGGPVLVDHDRRDHVGVVESVSIDSDRRGRAVVRFGNSARAREIFQDVVDGIRRSISVGYRIHKAVLEATGEDGDTYRVTDWEPFEISFVSIPADHTVGVGRSASEGADLPFEITIPQQEERNMPEQNPTPTPAPQPPVNIDEIRAQERQREQERVRTILAIGQRHGVSDLAQEFVNNGKSADEFRSAVLERMAERGKKPVDPVAPVDIELSDAETKRYSLVRALHAATTGDWRQAGFERELSETIGQQLKRGTEGFFVPTGLRMHPALAERATMVAGTPSLGGNTVPTELGSLIELLRNRMLVRQMGAQVLSGLQGNLAFPRQTGANTLYWVGENPGSDVTEGNATFDQVPLEPKTAQATTGYSRQLLAQSSLDVEAFVRNDLMQVGALGMDFASIAGTGTGNQPRGILNTTGIGSVSAGENGGAPTWAHIVALETEISADNADVGNLGYLTNAKVRGKLKTTVKEQGTGTFIWGDGSEAGFGMLNGYRAGVSNQVPGDLTKGTGTDLSAIIFGNWADLLIGEWGAMEILVDPYALKKQGLIEVTSIMMVDVAVRHPQSFAAMKDAKTS